MVGTATKLLHLVRIYSSEDALIAPLSRRNSFGFTLVELVVVMLIVAVIAVVALPRLSSNAGFESRTFHDEVIAALQYAQKKAIASRRNVCVAFTASTVTLTSAAAAGDAAACNLNLTSPSGATPYVITARSQAAFSPTPANFQFDDEGRPSGGTQVLQVDGHPESITVWQETGYVQ
jgi:MSHA pilin protein MshC